MAKHTIRKGECILSVADKYGFLADTLWNHAENAKLKQKRKDPSVLFPGDEVFIPDKQEKTEVCATEQKHRFRKKSVPAKMKVCLLINDKPRANKSYKLQIDGIWKENAKGKTDGDGFVEESIPPNAKDGRLVLEAKNGEDIYILKFGTLNPLDTEEGVKKRLFDFGYVVDGDLSKAVKAFQKKEGLDPANGTINDATKTRLKERFGQ